MEVVKETPAEPVDTGSEQPKLSREQRRAMDRIRSEVDQMYDRLCAQFFDFFIDNDPESEAVEQKAKELSSKWKVFCHRKNIVKELHGAIENFCTATIKEYKKAKDGAIEVPNRPEQAPAV